MVLQARPYVRVTALDIYRGDQFGIGDNTPQRLLANARVAGVADRVDVKVGDMRQMPFGDRSFDAAVSAYAIDHLGQDGVRQSLAEASRVLRPRGQLLLLVVNVDGWVRLAFPSLHGHGYFSRPQYRDRWRDALAAAGFDVIEDGTPPTTLYLLASRRAD
jgi:SAM-dependent methyltransferase